MIAEQIRTKLLTALIEERKHYGATMTNAECVQLLNNAAVLTGNGAGLLSKPSGNNGIIPGLAGPVSVDFIVFFPSGEGWDVLTDAGGASMVTGSIGATPSETFSVDRWMAAVPSTTIPVPVPTPTPVPVPVPEPPPVPSPLSFSLAVSAILSKLGDLDTRLKNLEVAHTTLLQHVDAARNVDIGIRYLGTASGRVKAFGEQ